jgi:hypothetical protein
MAEIQGHDAAWVETEVRAFRELARAHYLPW